MAVLGMAPFCLLSRAHCCLYPWWVTRDAMRARSRRTNWGEWMTGVSWQESNCMQESKGYIVER
jgi:hypothetical protein